MKSEIDFTIDTLKVFLSTETLQHNMNDIIQLQVRSPNFISNKKEHYFCKKNIEQVKIELHQM